MRPTYAMLDVETGGTDPMLADLLQVGLVILDDRFQVIDSYEANVTPSNGMRYSVTLAAMEHNRINLYENAQGARHPHDIHTDIVNLLDRVSPGRMLTIAGWTPSFDVYWMQFHVMSRPEWQGYFNYAPLDVCTLAQVAVRLGVIPPMRGLDDVAKHFGLYQEHRALSDCMVTREVWMKLEALLGVVASK